VSTQSLGEQTVDLLARLVPLSDDSDLRCIRPATRSINYADFPRILSGEPSEVTMAAIRDDR